MKATSPATAAAMLVCLLAVLLAGTYGPLKPFVQAVKQNSSSEKAFLNGDSGDELLKWIQNEAVKQRVPAIDAVNDRVWKAIPGYNGREADVPETYRKAKAAGLLPGQGADIPWVFREVEPKIQLKDIPMQPIYRGNPAKPMVSLMINVAWGDEYLMPMLEILKEENVHATFFFDGTWLAKNEKMAREIMARGHELSNHAYTHPNMSQLSVERQRAEIGKTEALLKKLGVSNVWFAPPSGDYNGTTVKAAAEYGLRTVLWTLDTVDWMKPSPGTIVSKVAARAAPGTLILMHPTASSRGALKGMIGVIRKKGYSLGTVSETLSSKRV